jgi:multidrug efflux pump subunit AcrA (membrane-fusion protein)
VNTVNDDFDEEAHDGEEFDVDLLEEELRQAASILDPVPAHLREMAVAAYALHDLDARIAELTFDSVVDAIPVRGAVDAPRMLTFRAGDVTVDVEVTGQELLGQVLPPQQALIEVLTGPQAVAPLVTDDMGRFTGDAPPVGPFALRLRAGGDVVVTEWLRV